MPSPTQAWACTRRWFARLLSVYGVRLETMEIDWKHWRLTWIYALFGLGLGLPLWGLGADSNSVVVKWTCGLAGRLLVIGALTWLVVGFLGATGAFTKAE